MTGFDIDNWARMMKQFHGNHFKECPSCNQRIQLTKRGRLFCHKNSAGEKCDGSGDYGHGQTFYGDEVN